MASIILTSKENEISRTLIFSHSDKDKTSDAIKKLEEENNANLKEKLKDRADPIPWDPDDKAPTYEPYKDKKTSSEGT